MTLPANRPLLPEKLLLIEGNVTAQRMIVAWPEVGMKASSDQRRSGRELVIRWAKLAGVGAHEINVWRTMLFDNGFIGHDGHVDTLAMQYIKREMIGRSKPLREAVEAQTKRSADRPPGEPPPA